MTEQPSTSAIARSVGSDGDLSPASICVMCEGASFAAAERPRLVRPALMRRRRNSVLLICM